MKRTLKVKTLEWVESNNFTPPCSPKAARSEFRKIRNQHGQVTPRDLWMSQRAKRTPMHAYFEWDQKDAADKYRDNQARVIMRCLLVEYEETSEPQALMVRTRVGSSRGYTEVHEALRDEQEIISLSEARSLVSKLKKRIRHLDLAGKLVREMNLFLAKTMRN